MNEKLNHLLEHHYSLYYADCISRAIFDDNISLEQFKEGFKETIIAEYEGLEEYDPFIDCERVRFAVFNERGQFLADFDVLDDAIYYKEENEPKNKLFSIEIIE